MRPRSVRREAVIPVPGGWVVGVVDLPCRRRPRGQVIICHGLTGDRCGPQRLLVVLAEELARAGFVAVRFDFRGAGDSSGRFRRTTFAGMRDDLRRVIKWVERNYPTRHLALAGVSTGGVIPAMEAPSQDRCRSVVLLSSDLVEDVRFPVSATVPIRGGQFFLPPTFFRERERMRPRSALAARRIATRVFYGQLDAKLAGASQGLREAGFLVTELKGVDHLVERLRVRRQIGRSMARFVADSLALRPPTSTVAKVR